jgi:dTDP-4-dehydrorhamnose reductase
LIQLTPKILLTGRNGQVGSELLALLPNLGDVIAPGRSELNLLDTDNIRRVVRDVAPQLIVNAAAYTAVDAAEADESSAHAINAIAPGVLAEEARKIGAVIIHYSTDYVFDGRRTTPYEENDPTGPINVYGKTKLAGEQAIRGSGIPHLIFRTAWVYAKWGRNFMLTILRLATEKEELRIVCDQVGAPTSSREIASATAEMVSNLTARSHPASWFSGISGTYHMTAAGDTNWFEFANAIVQEASHIPGDIPWFAAATSGRPLITRRIIPIATESYQTPASRPQYSVLSNALLTRTFGIKLEDWRTQLQLEFAIDRKAKKEAAASNT